MNCLQARTQAVCSRKQILLSPPLTQIHTSICTYNQSPPHPPTHKYIPARAHTNPSFLLSVSYKYIPLLEKRNPSLSCYHTNTYWYLHKEIPLSHSNKKCIPVLPQTHPSLPLTQIHTSTSTNKPLSVPLSYKCIPILAQTNTCILAHECIIAWTVINMQTLTP